MSLPFPFRLTTVILVLLTGCGGSDYDARYDCEETYACYDELGIDPGISVSTCVEISEAIYDDQDADTKRIIEDLFLGCSDLRGCDYVDCTGVTVTTGS